jgi:DNA sulfur modification protein DndB
MFADLNRYAVKPSASLGLLYDHRNVTAQLARDVSSICPVFRDIIETERSSLSPRSRKLFTLSALHSATLELFPEKEITNLADTTKWCSELWDEVGSHIPEWRLVRESQISAGEVRQTFIHSHAIVLHALGRVARAFVGMPRKEYSRKLIGLKKIDWSRKNTHAWEGRAMLGGTVAKSSQNVALTSNYIKLALGLKLTPEEQQIEAALAGGHRGKQRRSA